LTDEEFRGYKLRLLDETRDTSGNLTLDHYEYLHGEIMDIFQHLRTEILQLDVGIREECKKTYIAYKTSTNFVDIVPQASRLRLSLNTQFDEIEDPKGICLDVTNKGRWGNGDIEFGVSSVEDIEYAMSLIRQSYEIHNDEILL